jgi:nucleotide-binding universal stress UspA family protein
MANSAADIGSERVTDPLARTTIGTDRALIEPLVVATDGSRAATAALRVASMLAGRQGRRIEAVIVEETFPTGPEGVAISAETLRRERVPDDTRLGRVRRQLCAVLEANSWNLHVEFGRVGPVIASTARRYRAPLIIMGLSRHHPARRLLGGEAVVRVLRSAPVPVLAVAATTRGLPSVVVLGMDFSVASVRAAAEACALVQRPATLHLVHVRPESRIPLSDIAGWDDVYDAGVRAQLEKLCTELSGDGITAVGRVESGNISETLLRVASEVNAGLIACGTDSLSTLERLILGRVPTQLLRNAECSVLVAPCARSLNDVKESI